MAALSRWLHSCYISETAPPAPGEAQFTITLPRPDERKAIRGAPATGSFIPAELMSSSGEVAVAAGELTRALFSREMRGAASDEATAAAAERMCVLVTAGLSRWFGQLGSHALTGRALAVAQREHPALAGVTVTGNSCLVGLADSLGIHGAEAMTDGVIAMMAALATLIGRLIGDDLALSLLEQSTTASTANSTDDGPQPVKKHE